MNNLPIGVIDSGIGGLSVLFELDKTFSGKTFIYYGDNDNAPYGQKSSRELLSRALNCVLEMERYNVQAIVVACNTLSVSVLHKLEYYSRKKCFGVFPPVEKSCIDKESILICTPNTAKNYCNLKGVFTLPLPNLAKEIEDNLFSLGSVNLDRHLLTAFDHLRIANSLKIDNFYDFIRNRTLILGCTHYVLIKNQFINHFQPQKILSGNEDAIFNLNKYLEYVKSLDKYKENSILFIGKNALKNQKTFDYIRKKIKFF